MKVLITGGAGFIGSHVAENLCKDKRVTKITIIDNKMQKYAKKIRVS